MKMEIPFTKTKNNNLTIFIYYESKVIRRDT
jgi:hypothetical protein